MPKILSNIDLNNDSRASNALDSASSKDYVTQDQLPTTNTDVITYKKEYTCEENGTGNGRLSWGNGATDANTGAVMTEAGNISEISISTSASAINQNIDIEINNVVVASVSHSGLTGSYPLDIDVVKNDFLNVNRTSSTGGGVITATISVDSEVDVTLFRGEKGEKGDTGDDGVSGNSSISGGAAPPVNPAPLQSAYIQTNGDIYLSENTNIWTFLTNVAGQPAIISKFTNNLVTNIQPASASIFSGINTTPLFDQIGANINVTNDTITFLQSGTYEIYANIYGTSTVLRPNAGFNFVYNGTPTGRISASSYIRSASGHNEASSNLKETFVVAVNDTIQIEILQLAAAGTVQAPAGTAIIEIKKVS